MRLVTYSKSVEGRPLRLVIVSSPQNSARLDAIRAAVSKFADPRTIASPSEEADLVQDTPVETWISHCIHGNETALFEAVLWTLYTLAASDVPEVTVILNPVFNPDGHEIDPNHFLGYGYPAGEIAVPLSGDTFLKKA